MDKLIIIGAGGHGKVLADTAGLMKKWDIIGFVDDTLIKGDIAFNGKIVIGSTSEMDQLKKVASHFIIAVGNNNIRATFFDKFQQFLKPASLIHPNAFVSASAKVGEGTVVLAHAVINAGAVVGANCIVNSLSLVDHDSKIGDHSHISQATIVGSNCTIPAQYHSKLGEHIPSYTKLT